MIVLDYPDSSCRKFFKYWDTLLGPIDPNAQSNTVQIPLDLDTQRFEPKKRIFGENEIVHSSFTGQLFYYPILADCIPLPTTAYPRQLAVPYLESAYPLQILNGFGCPLEGALVHATASYTMQTVTRDSPTSWTIYRSMASSLSGLSYGYVYHIEILGWSSPTKLSCRYTHATSDGRDGKMAPYSYRENARGDVIKGFVQSFPRWLTTTGTSTYTVITTSPSCAISPGLLAQHLAVFADNLMQQEFPIAEENYGDMAARAAEKRKRIDTNLYEFLRDMGDVKSLIPKLGNLANPKYLTGSFLQVKYGYLPTISDLEKIVKGFKNRIPFLDRNGYEVLTSANIQASSTQKWAYTLEQHLKMAVANEDSDFLRLIERMDEWGFSPTSENLWDLVRLSFVVDWFVDVGGFLQRLDENVRLLRYNIPYVTMSRKMTVSGEIPWDSGLSTIGPISWRYYHRWVDSQCPRPPLTLSTTPTVSNHWLEAGALIIQRL